MRSLQLAGSLCALSLWACSCSCKSSRGAGVDDAADSAAIFDATPNDDIWAAAEVGEAIPVLLRGRRDAGSRVFDDVILMLEHYLCGSKDISGKAIEQLFPLRVLDQAASAACEGFFANRAWVPGDPKVPAAADLQGTDSSAIGPAARAALHHLLRAYYAERGLAARVRALAAVLCGHPVGEIPVERLFIVSRAGDVDSLQCGVAAHGG